MKKIPTIFKRNPLRMSELLREPHPDCKWVFDGEGVATQKYDGTCVKIEKGVYSKRREVKKGKNPPAFFIEETFDEITGKRTGWVPVDPTDKGDRWHMEAFDNSWPDGTYELVGPKVQDNPENYPEHILISHRKAFEYRDCPRTFDGIREWFKDIDIEGIVFHHPDGRMGKIKKKDYQLDRLPMEYYPRGIIECR